MSIHSFEISGKIVNTFSFRTIIATALVSAAALSGCGGSDSSNVRTLNSSINDPCISMYQSSGSSVVTAAITSSDCATSLVDVSPRHYKPAINTRNTNPYADRRDPSATQMDYNHEFEQFVIAYEARDASNVPIEYVQTTGDGKDIATNVYKRSKIVPLSANDQQTACVQPMVGSDQKTPAIGFNKNRSNDCKEVDSYQVTLYVGETNNQRILYELATWESYSFDIADNNFPVGLGYYAVVGLVNGYPHTKMVITRPSGASVNVAHYRYLEPTTTFQYSDGNTSSSSSSSTTLPLAEDLSTIPKTSDPMSTTTLGVEETTTTEALATTNATSLRSPSEACNELEGVAITPAESEWTDRTRFRLMVNNDCIANVFSGEYSSSSLGSVIHARNTESREVVRFFPSIRANGFQVFSGRLYAGNWTLTLEQSSSFVTKDNENLVFNAVKRIEVVVKADKTNPWRPCTSTDLVWEGNNLGLNCEFTSARLKYPTIMGLINYKSGEGSALSTQRIRPRRPASISGLPEGWWPITAEVNTQGYKSVVSGLICAEACDQTPAAIKTTLARTENLLRVKPEATDCDRTDISVTSMYFAKNLQGNLKALLLTQGEKTNYFPLTSNIDNIVPITPSAEHVVLFQTLDRTRPECASSGNFADVNWSLFPVPTNGSNLPDSEEVTVAPSLVVVNDLEYSTTNSIGSSIIVEKGQTVIEVPMTALPEITTIENSPVVGVSVLTEADSWLPLTASLTNYVKITDKSQSLKVKYTFADKSESIITKPIVNNEEFEKKVNASSDTSSNQILFISLIILLIVLLAGTTILIRRRK